MESTITNLRPVVDTQDDVVVQWVFRLTLSDQGVTALDDISVVPSVRKPLSGWTRQEVKDLVTLASTDHPLARSLRQRLVERQRHREIKDFSLDDLRDGGQA